MLLKTRQPWYENAKEREKEDQTKAKHENAQRKKRIFKLFYLMSERAVLWLAH